MRSFARPLLNVAIVAGLVLATLPVAQSLYGGWNQRTLAAQWQGQKAQKTQSATELKPAKTLTQGPQSIDSPSPALPLSSSGEKRAANRPWRLTKLSIPDINLETFIVQGMDDAALRRGPGHDPNSALPGLGNCVVAGHRNIYGSFFYRLDDLLPGALITLENRDGKFSYVVDSVSVTPATNLTILQPPPAGAAPVLTLVTCTLPHSSNRMVLQASLRSEGV